MATTKRIIDPITGMVREVVVESTDERVEREANRFILAAKIQASLGVCLDSRNMSVNGAGKHTGNMAKAKAAQGVVGAISAKAERERRHYQNASRYNEVVAK